MPVKQQQQQLTEKQNGVDLTKHKIKYSSVGAQKELYNWTPEDPSAICLKYSLKEDNDFSSAAGNNLSSIANSCTITNNAASEIDRKNNSSGISSPTECGNSSASAVGGPSEDGCSENHTSSSSWTSKSTAALKLDEAIRKERKRIQLTRQCIEYLELECSNSRLNKDNFRKGFLNKVRISVF